MNVTKFLGVALAVLSSPALAQSDNQGKQKDSLTIGVGAVSVPRYEGSNDNSITPAAAVRGSVSGISFTTQGTALYLDMIPREGQTGGKLVLGPVIGVDLNRTSLKRTRDPQIRALGKIDTAVNLGGQIGYSQNGVVTSDYDNLTVSVTGLHDVTGTTKSYVVIPSVSYGTPLSTKAYVGLSANAHYVGKGYAKTYFGVTPAGQIFSGLPAYTPGDGFKDVGISAIGNLSVTGDLRHGLSLFALGGYSKLLGEFKRSPVVRDSNQWLGGLGLAYTF